MKREVKRSARRAPTQERAKVTVDAMLDAAIRLLKRGGSSSITTNSIAETAGVSIGSVYQYFPNKSAIFIALHGRHIRQVDEAMGNCLEAASDSVLEEFVASLLETMIALHAVDPELSGLLKTEVPQSVDGAQSLSARLYKPLRRELSLRWKEIGTRADLDMKAFFLSNMIEVFGHAVVLGRPAGLSLFRAKGETLRAILSFLRS